MKVSSIQPPTQQGQDQAINILVIDDQQLFIDSLVYVLNTLSNHVEITQANSIHEAIDKLAGCDSYDIIILDLNIPGMDSLAFLHQMEMNEIYIPVVIISAEQGVEHIQQALELGAMGFIPKSYNADQMKSALRSVLEGNIYLPDELQLNLNNQSIQVD